jgi:Tyrosinase co-factor MelC1
MAARVWRHTRTRRAVLRAAFGLGAAGGTAAALTPVLRAPSGTGEGGAEPAAGAGGAPAAPAAAAETYKGRHISIAALGTAGTVRRAAVGNGVPGAKGAGDGDAYDVRIDGRPLHMMRRADGSWFSVVDHYESFPTPLAAARAAVDDLYGARLSLDGPMTQHA